MSNKVSYTGRMNGKATTVNAKRLEVIKETKQCSAEMMKQRYGLVYESNIEPPKIPVIKRFGCRDYATFK